VIFKFVILCAAYFFQGIERTTDIQNSSEKKYKTQSNYTENLWWCHA